jgi:CubicO group peptidase (beta-lactamase class C family)
LEDQSAALLQQRGLRSGSAFEAGLLSERIAHIRELARHWVATGVHDVIVLLVARRGIVALHEAFHDETRFAGSYGTDALFPLASLTKPITAAALMALVDEGLVGLTRPVAEYLPEFKGEGKKDVCVHHLLSHTSGLEDPHDEPERMAATEPQDLHELDATQDAFVERYLRAMFELPLKRRPAQKMSYCNLNYELLGEIVRRVSGSAFSDFCRLRIFDPIGMAHTYVAPPVEIRLASVRSIGAQGLSQEDLFLVRPSASGGVWSTASDMAAFAQMHLKGGAAADRRVLSAQAVREMTRNQIPGIDALCSDDHIEASWGFGWTIATSARCGEDGIPFRSNISRKMRFPTLARQSFSHLGTGGVFLWGDPENELVGAFFAASKHVGSPLQRPWAVDLFVNAVHAAIS